MEDDAPDPFDTAGPPGERRSAFDRPTDDNAQKGRRRRRLRAVLAADVAGFSGRVSVDETAAFTNMSAIRAIAEEALSEHDGWLFGMPGDGVFALFESSVDAMHCAIDMQTRIADRHRVDEMQLRIGLHAGEVLFENEIPFGETLAIAARLEALAEPGGILVSSTIADTASARVKATFEPVGVPKLKNIPRRIRTYRVKFGEPSWQADAGSGAGDAADGQDDLDRTMQVRRSLDDILPQETLDTLTAALAQALGPIASVVVERQARKAASLKDLVDTLAEQIPDEGEAAAFRARCVGLATR